jgi:hypothetical protein
MPLKVTSMPYILNPGVNHSKILAVQTSEMDAKLEAFNVKAFNFVRWLIFRV